MLLAETDVTHVLIVAAAGCLFAFTTLIQVIATILQSWWLRKQQKPNEVKVEQTERKVTEVYHAVNSGRMERLESGLEEVKKQVAKLAGPPEP